MFFLLLFPTVIPQLFPLIFSKFDSFNITKMSKSSHNSRKRRRSSSSDRLAALEEKMTRLIEALSRGEVSTSRSSSFNMSTPLLTSSTSYKHGALNRRSTVRRWKYLPSGADPIWTRIPDNACATGRARRSAYYRCVRTHWIWKCRREVNTAFPTNRNSLSYEQ